MWHDIVSYLASMAQVLHAFLAMGLQHPVTTMGLLLLFVVIGAMLCAEVVESRLNR